MSIRRVVLRCLPVTIAAVVAVPSLTAQQPAARPAPPPSIEERTTDLRKIDGYFPLYWDDRTGSLFLEIPRFDTEFLFTIGLSAGLGSNDIGLDRGMSGGGRIVRFERVGPKVLLVQPNQSFRASSPNPMERKSVAESFATSTLWGFTVAAESPGRVLVDATSFFLRDLIGAAGDLGARYRLEPSRSAFYLPNTKGFPKNTEVDVTLTFLAEAAATGGGASGPVQGPAPIGQVPRPVGTGGGLFSGSVGSVTPTPDAVTLREHASFVELPGAGYTPRADDPRAGYGGLAFVDYSAPAGEPNMVRWIRRHRLQKRDPSAAMSEPVQPIRYWIDPGAPEDVKRALIDGASWWAQAFEAAGFRNAFQVAVLPEGADPMDIRYNMINWVHRSTRGWSSGATIADPRTGEIIKATVTLGSLRDRQDYMIFEGLTSPYTEGVEKPVELYEAALMRIRQLAAHEVGHTLGLGHNYYDSEMGWISVMDYPHPLETIRPDGTIDLARAYAGHIGEWDKVAIDFGYREYASPAAEAAGMARILNDAWAKDLRYLTNQDIDLHPRADQWSNGTDQADELNRLMKVRRAALDRLGERTIRAGAPMALIEEPLVPIYMYHRYAVEGAASAIGGQDYIYAMRGDGRTPVQWESAANQRKALEALAATLAPAELVIPQRILGLIPPRPPGYGLHRELFPRTTGSAFDPLAPATIAADVTIGFVLQLDRAARLVAQHAVDPTLPGLEEVIERLESATFGARAATPYEAEVRRAEQRVLVDRVTWLASAAPNAQVRATASLWLEKIRNELRGRLAETGEDLAQHALIAGDIDRFLARSVDAPELIPAPPAPPGAPIGDADRSWLDHDADRGWLDPVPR